MDPKKYFLKILIAYFLVCSDYVHSVVILHRKFLGIVGGGNYSYYTLSQDGSVTIMLHTLNGDGDLYVSDKNMEPTFDLNYHNLQSVTCDEDIVKVPYDFNRPIGIGVYGHPSHDTSTYVLEVLLDDEPEFSENFGGYTYFPNENENSESKKYESPEEKEEEESLLWTMFVSILKVILEVIAD